jgi:hypothetical protein
MPGRTGKIPGIRERKSRAPKQPTAKKVIHPISWYVGEVTVSTMGATVFPYRAPCSGVIKSPFVYVEEMANPEANRVFVEAKVNGEQVCAYLLAEGVTELPTLDKYPLEVYSKLELSLRMEYQEGANPAGVAAQGVSVGFLFEVG